MYIHNTHQHSPKAISFTWMVCLSSSKCARSDVIYKMGVTGSVSFTGNICFSCLIEVRRGGNEERRGRKEDRGGEEGERERENRQEERRRRGSRKGGKGW